MQRSDQLFALIDQDRRTATEDREQNHKAQRSRPGPAAVSLRSAGDDRQRHTLLREDLVIHLVRARRGHATSSPGQGSRCPHRDSPPRPLQVSALSVRRRRRPCLHLAPPARDINAAPAPAKPTAAGTDTAGRPGTSTIPARSPAKAAITPTIAPRTQVRLTPEDRIDLRDHHGHRHTRRVDRQPTSDPSHQPAAP